MLVCLCAGGVTDGMCMCVSAGREGSDQEGAREALRCLSLRFLSCFWWFTVFM